MAILPPFVTLVDIDGFAVPSCEKDIPDVPPADPSDPSDWPAWTENWHWETSEPSAEDFAFADAMLAAIEPDDGWPDGPDAPDAGMSRSAALGELIRTGSVSALPPVSGGSDEAAPFEPSAEDLAEYHAWSEELERRRNAADRHSPDALARINLALYGRSEPFHA